MIKYLYNTFQGFKWLLIGTLAIILCAIVPTLLISFILLFTGVLDKLGKYHVEEVLKLKEGEEYDKALESTVFRYHMSTFGVCVFVWMVFLGIMTVRQNMGY